MQNAIFHVHTYRCRHMHDDKRENEYIEKAFGERFFGILWSICCVLASFGGGNMIQTNAAGAVFEKSFGISPVFIGIIIAVLTAAVLFCGAKAVLKFSSVLVPIMALIYVSGCFAALFVFRENVVPAFSKKFSGKNYASPNVGKQHNTTKFT